MAKKPSKDPKDLLLESLKQSRPALHWGDWIKARGLFVGFRRQKDLIAAIGCEQTTFFKWRKSMVPPERIQKGFDLTLAKALKLDRQTLFTGWRFIAPDVATIFGNNEPDSVWDHVEGMRHKVLLNMKDMPEESVAKVLKTSEIEVQSLIKSIVKTPLQPAKKP